MWPKYTFRSKTAIDNKYCKQSNYPTCLLTVTILTHYRRFYALKMASLLRSSKADRRSLKWCSILKMLVLLIIALSALLNTAEQALETDAGETIEGVEVLSRRKRYLIFPEGSSLQLGECWFFLVQTKWYKWFSNYRH